MKKDFFVADENPYFSSLKPISFEEHKQLQLEILEDVALFCENHSLEYFLISGTLLGAVRHKGFIPWDDDIDIMMPRASYNRLIELYNKEHIPQDKFYLVDPRTPQARHSIVKIINRETIKIEPRSKYKNGFLGVDIDIFPMDGEPDSEKDFLSFWKKLNFIYRVYNRLTTDPEFCRISVNMFIRFLKILIRNKNTLLNLADKLHKKYPYESSSYVGPIAHAYNEINNRFEKEWFDGFVMVDFEGKQFRAPANYDAVLRALWGDYMKLPPEDKRVAHHLHKIYWKKDQSSK